MLWVPSMHSLSGAGRPWLGKAWAWPHGPQSLSASGLGDASAGFGVGFGCFSGTTSAGKQRRGRLGSRGCQDDLMTTMQRVQVDAALSGCWAQVPTFSGQWVAAALGGCE